MLYMRHCQQFPYLQGFLGLQRWFSISHVTCHVDTDQRARYVVCSGQWRARRRASRLADRLARRSSVLKRLASRLARRRASRFSSVQGLSLIERFVMIVLRAKLQGTSVETEISILIIPIRAVCSVQCAVVCSVPL